MWQLKAEFCMFLLEIWLILADLWLVLHEIWLFGQGAAKTDASWLKNDQLLSKKAEFKHFWAEKVLSGNSATRLEADFYISYAS